MKKTLTLLAASLFWGSILHAQWNNLAPDGSDFTKIEFTSTGKAYVTKGNVSTMNMGMAKTIDAGSSWTNVPFNPVLSVRDFNFIDDNTGFAVADTAGSGSPYTLSLYKTINGGSTWNLVYTFVGALPYNARVHFKDALHGFVTETYNRIWITSNGGSTWTYQDFSYYSSNNIDFPSTNTGYIGGWDGTFNYYGTLLKTTDGGMTWNEVFNFSSMGEHYSTVNSLSFVDDNNGFMATQNYFYKTTDGGVTWDSLPFSQNNNMYFQDIYFFSAGYGYGCDAQGGIYKTLDGGNTWTVDRPADTLTWLYAMDADNGNIYVAGTAGKILEKSVLGIKENKKESLMRVYPNPSAIGIFYLQKKDAHALDVQVYAITGEQVYTKNAFMGQVIDLSHLPGGTYLLRYTSGMDTGSQLVSISK